MGESDNPQFRVKEAKEDAAIRLQAFWMRQWPYIERRIKNLTTPIIQFQASIFYIREDEKFANISVDRLVRCTGTSSVSWATRDWTAKEGQRYIASSGTIVFEPNEVCKAIQIPLKEDRRWMGTLEFVVVLSEPKNALLGKYLQRCRIKVVDCDIFPTNKYRKEIVQSLDTNAESIADLNEVKVPDSLLFLEYAKVNLTSPVVRRGTVKTIIVDLLETLSFLWSIYVMMLFVDNVLVSKGGGGGGGDGDDDEGGDEGGAEGEAARRLAGVMTELPIFVGMPKRRIALILSICYMIPMTWLHFMDVQRCKFKVGGGSMALLQSALLRRFLNYNETSRCLIHVSDLAMAMTRDAEDVVYRGYAKLLILIQAVGKLILIVLFEACTMEWISIKVGLSRFIPVLVFPIVTVLFIKLRATEATKLRDKQEKAQNHLLSHVDEVVSHFSLIASYNCRPQMSDMFDKLITKNNGSTVAYNKFAVHADYFSKWLTAIIVSMFLYYGGGMVIEGKFTPGVFLSQVALYKALGQAMQTIYQNVITMQSVMASLRHIIQYMNLPTSLEESILVNKKALARNATSDSLMDGKKLQESLLKPEDYIHVDRRKIEVLSASFLHGQLSVLRNVDFKLRQGTLTCVLGHGHAGKTTLIKLLAQMLTPISGVVHIPPHLRVNFIPQEPLLLRQSLVANLTFGLDPEHVEQNLQTGRIKRIMHRLGLVGDKWDDLLTSTAKPMSWHEVLSDKEKQLICFARAFVFNPELLIADRPLLLTLDADRLALLKVFRDFVDLRGLEVVEDDGTLRAYESIIHRRARTCVYTSDSESDAHKLSDHILRLTGGLCEDVTEDFRVQKSQKPVRLTHKRYSWEEEEEAISPPSTGGKSLTSL